MTNMHAGLCMRAHETCLQGLHSVKSQQRPEKPVGRGVEALRMDFRYCKVVLDSRLAYGNSKLRLRAGLTVPGGACSRAIAST